MPPPKGRPSNNPNHTANLRPFDNPDVARAAAAKSAETRRRNKQAKAVANAVANRNITEWIETYKREDLGPTCAAAAAKIAHMILSGEISDHRALVQALPTLVDIARLEAGQHTAATMHATVTSRTDGMARIHALREQASNATPTPIATHSTEPHASA